MQYALTIVANDSGLELIAQLDCRVRRRAHGAHAEEECGDSRIWRGYYLVTTRGVISFALVTSDSFPAKSTSVFVFWSTVKTVPVLSDLTGDEQLLHNAVCLVQEAVGTSNACCRCSFPCYQFILCTRLCVHDWRHAAHNGSRKSHVFISSHRSAEN